MLHGPVLIFVLAAFVLTFHHQARRQVGYSYGTLSFVDMLSSGAGGAESVYFQIVHVQLEVHFL